jgi:hypothetical protein
MFDILGVLATVVLFAGFVLLTLLLEACRWVYRQLAGPGA